MNRNATGRYDTTATGGETVRAFVPFPLPPEPPLDLSGNRRNRVFSYDAYLTIPIGGAIFPTTQSKPEQIFWYGIVTVPTRER